MNHYDIYADLGIDRAQRSEDIVAEIDQRMSATPPDDNATLDMLRTSRDLFADESRRKAYDEALDNPAGPALGIGDFRQFANGTYPQRKQETQASKPDTPGQSNGGTASPTAPASTAQQAGSTFPAGHTAPAAAAGQPAGMTIDLRTLAVAPGRQRSESLMWLIGFGIILLAWVIALFSLLFGESETTSVEFLDEGAKMIADGARFVLAFVHTFAMLVVLQFLWNLRMYIGKKIGL